MIFENKNFISNFVLKFSSFKKKSASHCENCNFSGNVKTENIVATKLNTITINEIVIFKDTIHTDINRTSFFLASHFFPDSDISFISENYNTDISYIFSFNFVGELINLTE